MSNGKRTEPNDIELRKRIARWLRWYINTTGASQVDVAEALDITEPHVSNLVNEHRWAGLDTFVRMHLRFGLSMELMVREDPRPGTTAQPASPTALRAARK